MVRRTRKPPSSTPGARPSTPWVARVYPALSDDWVAVTSPVVEPARPRHVPRTYRRRLAPTPPQTSHAVTPPKAPKTVFGGWTLTPRGEQQLQAATTCARRHSRRQTLFAKRLTGPGAGAPKKHFTNRRCK